jgi:FkbM family methyltransferase
MRVLRELVEDARRLGATASFRFLLSRRALLPLYGDRVSSVKVRGVDHRVWFRHGTSDKYVIREIFANDQYGCLCSLDPPRLIADLGANIGATSVYLLRRFPRASLIAVEPDPGNFAILQRNLAPYADRVQLLRRAVWPSEGSVRLERGTFRDGREWSIQVRECGEGDRGDARTITPQELTGSGRDVVDLMKIDIERAELALFSSPRREWLGRVRAIAIELHDRECRDAFFGALSGFDYELEHSGELTICRNLRRASPFAGLLNAAPE